MKTTEQAAAEADLRQRYPRYAQLIEYVQQTSLLGSTASLLSWDHETMLPPGRGAAEHRSRQQAQLAELVHERRVHPSVSDWLAACEQEAELTDDPLQPAAVNLREIRRDLDRATKLPAALVCEFSEATSMAHYAWLEARQKSDYRLFEPSLERIIELNRRRAECWGVPEGGELWDALAEGFDPGLRATDVEQMFQPLRADLTQLVQQLTQQGRRPPDRFLNLQVPVDQQRRFVRELAKAVGFDFSRGRLDESVHPFCQGIGPDDVRMTCRFDERMLHEAIGSTLHESGHGLYDQNLPAGVHAGTPMGQAVGLTVHESQSRLLENHIGRSAAFWKWCHPRLHKAFGAAMAEVSFDDAFGAMNLIEPSLIRVEADEATYHLHILIRFELERAMIGGDLSAAQLPQAWNELYGKYLDVDVPDDRRGCLQDIHWANGAMGYFPTYTLGSMHAAQYFETARQEIPDLENQIEQGEFVPLINWLAERIHSQGKRYRARELCRQVTGAELTHQPLLAHLRAKLERLYEV